MAQICYGCFSQMSKAGTCPRCGYNSAEAAGKYPQALREGTLLKRRYMLGRVMGQGGFGITYAALDISTNTRVAIKEYLPSAFASRNAKGMVTAHSVQVEGNFEHGKESFLEEANALVELKESPYVVNIHDFFEENGTAYFVMEYVQGTNLKSYVKMMGGNLGEEAANHILLPIMEALEYVHSKGLVHRDIAPDNIIVTSDGSAKLIDFGAARYSTGEMSLSLDVILKHGYAPKEQYVRKGRQGPFTDVYAMGATYYYAVTGRTPPDSVERMSEDELIPPSTLGAKLSRNTEMAILKALELQPADRFQSMADFASAIKGEAAVTAPAAIVKPAKTEENSLLDRAAAYIKEAKWDSAVKCCELILDTEPDNEQAIIYKRMAELELNFRDKKKAKKEKPEAEKTVKNSKKKAFVAALVLIILVIAAGAAYFGVNYNAAITAMNEERFSEAQQYFDKLMAADKLFPTEVGYVEAGIAFQNKEYYDALLMFDSLENFQVPEEYITSAKYEVYRAGAEAYNDNDLEEAEKCFSVLGDYNQSEAFLTLIAIKNGDKNIEECVDEVSDLIGITDAADVIMQSERAKNKFLAGKWGYKGKLFNEYLLATEEGTVYCDIDVGNCIHKIDRLDSSSVNRILSEGFLSRIIIISRDSIEVSFPDNGCTHTLTRAN